MGVFNKTPYTNFHELNLNWIIKKIKEVAADNTFFKQFFKYVEDEHILGVVTDVTENNDNTVKIDYWNEDTQLMDDYTVYNKTGTDGAISGAVSPIADRVTSAEGRLDDAEGNINTLATTTIRKNLNIGSTKIIDFIHSTSYGQGHYILNVQNAPDNPAGTGNTCTVVLFKPQTSGAYSYLFAFRPGKVWICYSSITVSTTTLLWKELLNDNTAVENLTLSYSNASSQLSNISVIGKRFGKVILVSVSFTASSFPLNTTYQMSISGLPARAGSIYLRARALSGFHSVDGYIGPDGVAGFRCLDSTGITASTNFSNFNFIYLEA